MRRYGSGYNDYNGPHDDDFDDILPEHNTQDRGFDDRPPGGRPSYRPPQRQSRGSERRDPPRYRDSYNEDDGFDDIVPEPSSQRDDRPRQNADMNSPPPGTRSGRRFIILLLLFFITVNLVIFGIIVVNHNYAFIGKGLGNIYVAKINSTELDLGDSKLTSFEGIERLQELRTLDLRGLPITVEQFESIRSSVPEDCVIHWNISIGGKSYDSDVTAVSFTDATPEEIDSLRYFDNLETVDATGCRHYRELKKLSLEMPSCNIIWSIPIDGVNYPSTTTEITLSENVTPEQLEDLKLLPWLVYIAATAYKNYDALVKLSRDLPNCEIMWKINLAGVTVKSTSSSVDLSGSNITDLNDLKTKLAYLPNLDRIDMCDCNLSNEQMGELRDMYPDKKFIWVVSFGNSELKTWKVRTDATIFSTLNPAGGMPYDQDVFAPLFLYCTDLVALDLGHNQITDISLISNLKELKFLILGDNHVKDISPLASLKKLEYLEIWYNDITDASPLSGLENLLDVDLANNYISDLSPFYPMKQLLSLRLDDSLSKPDNERNVLTYAQLNKLAAAIPQCKIERYHADAFRYFKNNPRYLSMKMAFSNYDKVIYFRDWDDVKYSASFYN